MSMQKSPLTVLAGEALEPRRLVKYNGTTWVYADAADIPIGVHPKREDPGSDGTANGKHGPIHLLSPDQTVEVEAAGTITAGAEVFAAADGKISASGTNAVGIALQAGSAGSSVEIIPYGLGGRSNLVTATYYFTGTPDATNQVFFVADRPYLVVAATQVHSTAAGGTSTLDITNDSDTDAPAAGDLILAAPFNLNATANTPQAGTLSATAANLQLKVGSRLATKFNHAIQSSAGIVVTVVLKPI